MIGLLLLILIAALLVELIGVIAVAWEALHPPRRTTAWALARGTPADPEPFGRPWRFETRRCCDGAETPLWLIEGCDPRGPAVIIVHGWGRSRWDSLRRAGPFLARARVVVLPDLRAHGEAPGGTTLGATEAGDIALLAAEWERCLLVGHSMGAGIVIRAAAAMHPPPLGVVALAPYRRVVTPIWNRLRLRALPAVLLAPPAVWLLRALGVNESPIEAAAARLDAPLLVISAAGDPIAPAADGEAIAAAASTRARYERLPGTEHADPDAGARARYASILESFLAEVGRISEHRPSGAGAG